MRSGEVHQLSVGCHAPQEAECSFELENRGFFFCQVLHAFHLEEDCSLFFYFLQFLRYRVDSSQGPRMAAEDALYGEIRSFKHAKTTDRFVRILGAGGVEFASWLGRETTKRPVV